MGNRLWSTCTCYQRKSHKELIDYISSTVPSNKIIIGYPTIAYDWQLPYTENKNAVSLSLSSVITLANDTGSYILYDESSQTPFFYYQQYISGFPSLHIVRFVDARTVYSLDNILTEYNLSGGGVWNIMVHNPQLWTAINSTFDTTKLL